MIQTALFSFSVATYLYTVQLDPKGFFSGLNFLIELTFFIMKPTEILKEEHQSILGMLKVLEKVCDRLKEDQPVPPEHLEKILEFIRMYADKLHHGKEEDILFPAMEAAGIPRDGGPIGVMLMEHQMGREAVSGMSRAIEDYKKNDVSAGVRFAGHARDYISLLFSHIDKEDNCLFPMADQNLAPEKQALLMEDFKKVDQPKIDKGKVAALKQILQDLQEEYL